MKLPSVFANTISKQLNNNIDFFRSQDDRVIDLSGLIALFDKNGFGDRINVEIKTKDGNKSEKLILCKSNYFINIYNKKIYFDEILDYKIKK